MEQMTIRRLKTGTWDAYRAAARAKGRSMEAEVREVLEHHAPTPSRDRQALVALSRQLRALTAKPGLDSTPYIREMRETNGDEG